MSLLPGQGTDFCIPFVSDFTLLKSSMYSTVVSLTSDEQGDRPRPLPEIPELKDAKDITERKGKASWDWKVGLFITQTKKEQFR